MGYIVVFIIAMLFGMSVVLLGGEWLADGAQHLAQAVDRFDNPTAQR